MVVSTVLLRHQRHADEARDGRAAALRGADAARRGGEPVGPAAAVHPRLRQASCRCCSSGGCWRATSPRWRRSSATSSRSPTCRSPMPRRWGRSRRCWCCSGASLLFREKIGGVRMALIGARLHRRADGGAADDAGHLDLRGAGARQRGALRGARPRRPPDRGRGAGADRRDVGGGGGAGRGGGDAPRHRAVGDAGAATTCCCCSARGCS